MKKIIGVFAICLTAMVGNGQTFKKLPQVNDTLLVVTNTATVTTVDTVSKKNMKELLAKYQASKKAGVESISNIQAQADADKAKQKALNDWYDAEIVRIKLWLSKTN